MLTINGGSVADVTDSTKDSRYVGGVQKERSNSFIGDLAHDFGGKDIGYLAGIALLINNITGPGIPGLPNLFVEAGWLFPVAVTLLIWLMTTLSASMYCEAMRCIPNNEHFRNRIEFSTIVRYYFGHRWYVAAQVGLNGALQSLNIISVIQSAQVMDNALSVMFGSSVALNLTPFKSVWTDDDGVSHNIDHSTDFLSFFNTNELDRGNAWGCHVVITAGFLIVAAMAIPCGRWNLDDNMIIQIAAFFLTIVCWIFWILVSMMSAPADAFTTLPPINKNSSTGSQAAVLGTILFNFGFVTTVPSWVNEKRPHVSVNKSLWYATISCVAVFFLVGIPGAISFQDVLQGPVTGKCARQETDPSFNCPNDLMQALTDHATIPASWRGGTSEFLLKLSVYLFPIVAVVSSIPVFSIVIKYNMVENGFSPQVGFLWGIIFPWVAAMPLLYMPNILAQFVNFTSLFFVSFTDFIVPCLLYIELQRRKNRRGSNALLNSQPPPEDVHEHFTFGGFDHMISGNGKMGIAVMICIVLTVAAIVATVLTITQGTYELDQQTCALVGS